MPFRPVVPKVDFYALPVKTEGAQALRPPGEPDVCVGTRTHTHTRSRVGR